MNIIVDYIKAEIKGNRQKAISLCEFMTAQAWKDAQYLLAIKIGVDKFRETKYRFWREDRQENSLTPKQFVSRAPKTISWQKLKSLVKKYPKELCYIAKAKKVEWRSKQEYGAMAINFYYSQKRQGI